MSKDSIFPAKLILAFGLLIAIVVCVGVIEPSGYRLEGAATAKWLATLPII